MLLILLLLLLPAAVAVPKRGVEPWSVILCKFADSLYEPRTGNWFKEWISDGRNQDTIESYFSSVSNKVYSIEGSTVTNWLRLPWTKMDVIRMARADPRLQSPRERPFALYDKAKELCIEFAEQSGYRLHKMKITVINQEQTAIYGKGNGVLLTPKLIFTSVLAHEMVHSMNIGHSYSDRKIKIFPYASFGEYDDKYDLMSTANAHMRPSTYGLSGPGLIGPHLDYLGWLPMNRMTYFGRDGRHNYTLRLSSLSVSHRKTDGWLMVMLPYDRDDPGNVYTVEFRTPVGNDAGIEQASLTQGAVVIHKVQRMGGSYYSVLVTHARQEFNELTGGTEWVQFMKVDSDGSFQYVRVRVERIHPHIHSADIRIVSTFQPRSCLAGETAVPTRMPVSYERRQVEYVCLDTNRTITQTDVDLQWHRNNFFRLRRTFGQNECIEGMEWRAIDAYDYVCVKPRRVDAVKVNPDDWDEMEGSGNDMGFRHKKHTHDECPTGLQARHAFPGDSTCVSYDEWARITKENSDNPRHLRYYAFFNGNDAL